MRSGDRGDQQPLEWETELAPPELADRWILSRFNRVALEVGDALTEYRLHEAATQILSLFWGDFCDWYIELTKPFVTAAEVRPEDRAVKRRLDVYARTQSATVTSDHAIHHRRAVATAATRRGDAQSAE
jgi:valyl-tRNA synthetase